MSEPNLIFSRAGFDVGDVLPQTSVENARIMAEQMRNAVYGLRIRMRGRRSTSRR